MNNITFGHVERGVYNSLVMYMDGFKVGDSSWVDHDYNANEIIEYTTFKSYDSFRENDSMAYIEHFYIEPEYRGNGYSKKLIRKTLSLIRQKKYNRHISLVMHPFMDSNVKSKVLLRLYRSFGFKSQYGCNEHWMHIYKKRRRYKQSRVSS